MHSQLSRITVSIRKAGTNARIQKADASYDPHHPQIEALSLHLQLLLLAKPSRNGALQAKKTSAQGMLLVSCIDDKPVVDSYSLTAIQQRLIEANLKRRNRFLYAQRHAMKLRERDQVPSTSIPTPQKLPSPPVLNTLKRTAEKHEVPKVNSTTTATEVQDPIPLPTQATTQPATTVISAISSRVTYPKPPPVRNDRNQFRKHLSKDILPYTCILEDCPDPEKLYQTKHLWLSHMFTDHGGISHWACLACNDSNERPVFYEQSEFTKHLEGTHSKGIKPHQIPMLVSAWQRKTSVAIHSCPLCGFEDQDSDVVLNHAAEHLHSFSLSSLPWAPGEERSIDRESERSCSTMLSEQEDLEELPAMGSGGETTENNQLTEENIRDLLTNPNVENDMLDAFLNGVENQEFPQEPSALAITNLASTVPESRSSSVAGSVNERPASIISSLPSRSNPSPAASNTDVGDEGREKRQCPWPDCGRSFKDLKAHILTHQNERPEKCPIVSCEYHIKGFARKYDRNRHTLTHYKGQMVCGFCPNSGSAAEKIFNRADVFKRHLISTHGVGQIEFNYRQRSPISSSMEQQKPLPGYSEDATGKCSTCSTTFSNAQDFYEHLDDCILRAVQQEEPKTIGRSR
ncbi:hypothetical protein DPV78_007879 [Talaromyces pinophilus]|nr:hypothetical protein DPV78_007879 [Talaromyces pinophilus]